MTPSKEKPCAAAGRQGLNARVKCLANALNGDCDFVAVALYVLVVRGGGARRFDADAI